MADNLSRPLQNEPSPTDVGSIHYMSKNFFGLSLSHREPPAVSSKTEPKAYRKRDQVSALYELGLLDDSDKRTIRRENKGREAPGAGGARVAASHLKKSTTYSISILDSAPHLSVQLMI